MWQDYVMSLVGVMFAGSMVPTILASVKAKSVTIPWLTLIVTVFGLTGIVICMASFGLILAVITNGCNCLCWTVLIVLKKIYQKKERKIK